MNQNPATAKRTDKGLKNKGTLNLTIDLIMLFVMSALSGIGLMLKLVLPPGRERTLQGGAGRSTLFWGLDRHQWGDIHLILALILIGLLVLHILFHWSCIVSMIRCRISGAGTRTLVFSLASVLVLLLWVFPFLFSPSSFGEAPYRYRHVVQRQLLSTGAREEKEHGPSGRGRHHSGDSLHGDLGINGRSTVSQLAEAFDMSPAQLLSCLGFAADTDATETLGRLRRQYGLELDEMLQRLQKKRKANE